jgi:hypothetical protein
MVCPGTNRPVCAYFRAVDPVSQSQSRRRTTLSLNKRDLVPLAEDDENDMDEDTDTFTDNEGELGQWRPVMFSLAVMAVALNYSSISLSILETCCFKI